MPDTAAAPRGIDPRGPRFVAAVTSALLLIDVFLGMTGLSASGVQDATLAERAADPGFTLLLAIVLLFVWGVASPRTAPWAALYRVGIQPRLAPPAELEDPRPPRFAQGVGLFVTGIGVILHLAGIPWALTVAAAAAFVASFLNAAFAFCLGCQLYLLLQRAGVVGRRGAAA